MLIALSNLDWSLLVAALSAVAAVVAAIVAVRTHERAKVDHALDLRLRLKRARNDAHMAVVALVDLHGEAAKSRERVAVATGDRASDAMQHWQQWWDKDGRRISKLARQVPKLDANFDDLSSKELEATLVELHRTMGWIESLTQQYREDLESDSNEN
ncbi:MAG: hypothetical protein ACR2RB_07290 [Gammaproteobacteria bacterium]